MIGNCYIEIDSCVNFGDSILEHKSSDCWLHFYVLCNVMVFMERTIHIVKRLNKEKAIWLLCSFVRPPTVIYFTKLCIQKQKLVYDGKNANNEHGKRVGS